MPTYAYTAVVGRTQTMHSANKAFNSLRLEINPILAVALYSSVFSIRYSLYGRRWSRNMYR